MTLSPGSLVLVTGASGYVGSRLVPLLLRQGYRVRCLVRQAQPIRRKPWAADVEIVEADLLLADSLPKAMVDVAAVYYLVHGLGHGAEFVENDLRAACNCAEAAKAAGVSRLLYLGDLGDPESRLSPHLRSRQEMGHALASAGVPVTEFRAAVVLGSGSLFFELIRNLTERLPVMICPYWIYTRIQPIAIRDVLDYLVAALAQPDSTGRVIEIGGQDVLTYGGLMETYAAIRGLRRRLIQVQALIPRVSSYGISLVTTVPMRVVRSLIEGLRREAVVHDELSKQLFPGIQPLDCRAAVEEALREGTETQLAVSRRFKPDVSPNSIHREGMFHERVWCRVATTPGRVYAALEKLGGDNGWPAWNWAWQLRGAVDQLLGGVGMRRGATGELRVGESLDFWRIDRAEPERLLRLQAEMKLPGRAWLQFQIQPEGYHCRLVQTALFEPKGLAGILYWYALYPVHHWIFRGMLKAIEQQACHG